MANWWVTEEDGVNWLAGVVGDTTNPPRLPDASIIDFLMQYPQARTDYDLIVPTMLAEEQTRLAGILAANPKVQRVKLDVWDNHTKTDHFQKKHNTAGIHLRPPRPNKPR